LNKFKRFKIEEMNILAFLISATFTHTKTPPKNLFLGFEGISFVIQLISAYSCRTTFGGLLGENIMHKKFLARFLRDIF